MTKRVKSELPPVPEQHITAVRVRFVRDDAPFRRGDLKDCTVAEADPEPSMRKFLAAEYPSIENDDPEETWCPVVAVS